jgi:hypothetical protein
MLADSDLIYYLTYIRVVKDSPYGNEHRKS